MNQDAPTLAKRLKDLNFEIDRSIRYCDHRIFFWNFFAKSAQVLEALTASAAFVSLFAEWTTIAHICIAITAVVSILAFTLKAVENTRFNVEKKSKFSELAIKIPGNLNNVTEEQYEIWRAERLMIDNDESTHIPCLSVICHNEVCLAKKIDDFYPLSFFEEHVGKYIPIPYRSRRTPKANNTGTVPPSP